jgi:alkanesulfonate monooxygenase SsuD/methylene tetrahydromethanopterin reductase-like flavin-dependent oxidoreductase (luciferase family)
LLTTPQQRFLALTRNQSVELKPPVDSMEGLWTPWEKQAVDARLRQAVAGGPETVTRKLREFAKLTGVQEIFAVTDTYEQSDRLRSYSLLVEVASKTSVAE